MAKYGNHLNTIIKKAEAIEKLSDLPEIIRPYQYTCDTYNPVTHNRNHATSHTKVGFIGSNQDMAYYFDFPVDDPGQDSVIKSVKDAVESPNLRSPMIFRKYLEQNFFIYKTANVGNQSMSFSFADYDADICFVLNAGLYADSSVANNYIFYMYYYPTQTVYIFISKGYSNANNIEGVYLKFTPKSKINPQNTLKLEPTDEDYIYYIDGEIKDISCYQIYYEDNEGNYRRIPNEYVESITYPNNYPDGRDLNSQQISYFTQKTSNPNFIELKYQNIDAKFYNIDELKNSQNLYLYISDDGSNKNDRISDGKIERYNGAKVLIKKMKQSSGSNTTTIPMGTDKTDLIYKILKDEKLAYQDHLYFDINTAELYFEDFGTGIGSGQYAWYPYIVDESTEQKFSYIYPQIYLRIDHFLNDNPNQHDVSNININIGDFIDDSNDGSHQDNTGNIPFFNYSDTFNTLPDTLKCTDVVFVKDSTDDDTDAFKGTISPDFVIDGNKLSHIIVETELEKEDPGSASQNNGYKTKLKNLLTSNNIVTYSKSLLDNLNDTKYGILSSNIENFSSFLNISMNDGDDVVNNDVVTDGRPVNIYSNSILSIRYNSNYDYFIFKNMTNSTPFNIQSIYIGIGSYSIMSYNLAANAIYIEIDKTLINRTSYLPFIQYLGQDMSGHPTWYIPNILNDTTNTIIPQIDIYFEISTENSPSIDIKGFYF